MSKIRINTDRINVLAESISIVNQNQQSNFNEMSHAVDQLNKNWNSNTGRKSAEAFSKYREMEKARFENINEVISVLRKEVAEGTETTEVHQISLAERFK